MSLIVYFHDSHFIHLFFLLFHLWCIILTLHLQVSVSPSQTTQNGGYAAFGKYSYDAILQRIRVGELVQSPNGTLIKDVLLLYREVTQNHTHGFIGNRNKEHAHTLDFFFISQEWSMQMSDIKYEEHKFLNGYVSHRTPSFEPSAFC